MPVEPPPPPLGGLHQLEDHSQARRPRSRTLRSPLLRQTGYRAEESPAPLPKNSSKAGTKSPLERPCRYNSGRTSEAFGDFLMYGGTMTLRNLFLSPFSSTLRSLTFGALACQRVEKSLYAPSEHSSRTQKPRHCSVLALMSKCLDAVMGYRLIL
jgi:hypothetical protein